MCRSCLVWRACRQKVIFNMGTIATIDLLSAWVMSLCVTRLAVPAQTCLAWGDFPTSRPASPRAAAQSPSTSSQCRNSTGHHHPFRPADTAWCCPRLVKFHIGFWRGVARQGASSSLVWVLVFVRLSVRCPVSRIVTQYSFSPSYWFNLPRGLECRMMPGLQWLSPRTSHFCTAALIRELSRAKVLNKKGLG